MILWGKAAPRQTLKLRDIILNTWNSPDQGDGSPGRNGGDLSRRGLPVRPDVKRRTVDRPGPKGYFWDNVRGSGAAPESARESDAWEDETMRRRKKAKTEEGAGGDWNAKFAGYAKPRMSTGRRQGLFIMLLAVGIPFVVFFFQKDGNIRITGKTQFFERTLTAKEKAEILLAVEKQRSNMDEVQRIVEEIKEKYRAGIGEDYYRDLWIVRVNDGFSLPYKYVLGLCGILFLVGLGKLIL